MGSRAGMLSSGPWAWENASITLIESYTFWILICSLWPAYDMEFNTQDHLLQEKIHAIIDAYINGQHGISHWGEFLKSIGVLESDNTGFTHYTRKYSITDPRAFMMACIQYGF